MKSTRTERLNNYDPFDVTETVEIDPRDYPWIEKCIYNPVSGDNYAQLIMDTPFLFTSEIELESNNVLIESIKIQTSDESLPFRFILSESTLSSIRDWKKLDMIGMEPITERAYTYTQNGTPFGYVNKNGLNTLNCGLVLYFNNRIYNLTAQIIDKADEDIEPDEMEDTEPDELLEELRTMDSSKFRARFAFNYFRKPITFQIKVKYLLPKHLNGKKG